jgi:hypothetical protein
MKKPPGAELRAALPWKAGGLSELLGAFTSLRDLNFAQNSR